MNTVLNPRRLVAGFVGLLMTFTLEVSAATAANVDFPPSSEAYVDNNGTVHYPYDSSKLPGAMFIDQQGTATQSGACTFTGNATTISPAESPTLIVAQEVTFNPESCTHKVAIASYQLASAPDAILANLTNDNLAEVKETTSNGEVTPQASWFASINARIQDPVGIHVSSTTTERTWSSTGSWHNTHRWGWYTPTGWSRLTHSTVGTSTIGDTRGTFQNFAFCNPFAATNTNHSRTRLTTNTSGGVTWGYTMNKSGDCSALLSYHYSVIIP